MDTHGIDISGGIGFNPGKSDIPAAANRAGRGPAEIEKADLTLRNEYAQLIQAALKSGETNTAQVQEAVNEIAANTLETPENIRIAAENILKFGI